MGIRTGMTRRKIQRDRLWLIGIAAGTLGIITWMSFHFLTEIRKVVLLTEPVVVELGKAMPSEVFYQQLEEKKLVSDSMTFRVWLRLFSDYRLYQAGTYQFENSFSLNELHTKLTTGDVFEPVILKLTVPEGYTFKQISEKLVEEHVGTEDELARLLTDKDMLRKLGVESPSLEGYFYPATYSFRKIMTPADLIAYGVQTRLERITPEYKAMIKAVGLTLHGALTFASLIEAETKFDDEKPLVSEVIWSRLKKGEPLGIDAALIYGIPDYAGDIKWKHLRDKNNLYNTRIHKGLPPGPIGSPGQPSLDAVVNPSSFGYHFYVTDPTRPGRHAFSVTMSEHNEKVRTMLRAQH